MLRLDLHRRYQLGRFLRGLHALTTILSRPLMLALLLVLPVSFSFIKLAGIAGDILLRAEFDLQIERSTAIEVVDRDGARFVLPGILEYADYSDGTLYPPDHKSRTPAKVSEYCWQILVALEDRRRKTIFHVGGIDLLAVAAVPRDLALGRRRGASTIEMQLLRSIYNLLPTTGWISDARRKIMEFALAPGFARFIERRGGERLLARLAMTHLPMAIGPGGTLHGIVEAAEAVFGKRPEDLTLAECAYLMAGARYQIRVGHDADPDAHRHRLARARYGLLLGLPDSAARRRNLDRLARMPAPSRHPANRTDPQRMVIGLARGEMVEVIGELKGLLGKNYWRRVHAVGITLSIRENHRRKTLVESALAESELQHRQRLTLPLISGPRTGRAQIFIAGATGKGDLALYYNNRDDAVLSGSRQIRDHLGHVHRAARTRSIGSLGKAILALPLAHHFNVDQRVCNRSIASGAVRNPDGDHGSESCDAASMINIRTAFARSLNLPLIEACQAVPIDEIEAVLMAWHANLPPERLSHLQLCRWIVLQAVIAPAPLLAGFHALGRALLMDEPGIARISRMVKNITWRDPTDDQLQVADLQGQEIDLSPFLNSAHVKLTVLQWLGAPTSKEGTARSIGRLGLPVIAKTGTVSLRNGRLRDQWLLTSLLVDGEVKTFLFLAGASHRSKNLAFPGSDRLFASSLRAILNDLDGGRSP